MYKTLLSYLFRLSQFAVWLGGAMMLVSAVMVSADVIARKMLGFTMGGSDEISGYLFAIATAFAFPYALLHRANVRIDVAYMRLGQRLRGLLDIFGLAMLTTFAAVITWRAFVTVQMTWAHDAHSITPLRTPLILPQGLWFLGWCLFCVTLAFVLFGLVVAWLRRDAATVQSLGGALSMEEEISEETEGVLPVSANRPDTPLSAGE